MISTETNNKSFGAMWVALLAEKDMWQYMGACLYLRMRVVLLRKYKDK